MKRDLVTVATFSLALDAESVKLRFEHEGLTCFLADANIVTTDWLLGNAVGNIKLQVPTEQVAAATALWEQICRERKERETTPDTNACLVCGAVMADDAVVCTKCGWSFTSGAGDAPQE
jgi:uncharacterized paraquat-inducible protein A